MEKNNTMLAKHTLRIKSMDELSYDDFKYLLKVVIKKINAKVIEMADLVYKQHGKEVEIEVLLSMDKESYDKLDE